MSLVFESPRFSLRTAELEEIDNAVRTVGHAVVDDAWNPTFLTFLLERARAKASTEATNINALFDTVEEGARCDQKFYSEFMRAGWPALLKYIFGGDFVLQRSERVIRYVDPKQPVKFTGLHNDHQLEKCFNAGIESKRGATMWTPLQACTDENISRLLLLHKGDDYRDAHKQIYLHRDETRTLVPDRDGLEAATIDDMFAKVYATKRCYAPYVPLGSAIIFDSETVHSTYRTASMTTPRYSIDCRAVGEYKTNAENIDYTGVLFKSTDFPSTRRRTAQIFAGAAMGDRKALGHIRSRLSAIMGR